jgi:hypothetical protein
MAVIFNGDNPATVRSTYRSLLKGIVRKTFQPKLTQSALSWACV